MVALDPKYQMYTHAYNTQYYYNTHAYNTQYYFNNIIKNFYIMRKKY